MVLWLRFLTENFGQNQLSTLLYVFQIVCSLLSLSLLDLGSAFILGTQQEQ